MIQIASYVQLAHAPTDEALTDKSVAEWFEERCGAARAKRVIPLLDAFYANDLCSDLRSLGVAEAAWEARHWSDGEDTLVKGGTMAPLTTALARGVPVRMGWPVREVRWRAQGSPWAAGASGAAGGHAGEAAVEIEGENGEVWRQPVCICACMGGFVHCSVTVHCAVLYTRRMCRMHAHVYMK